MTHIINKSISLFKIPYETESAAICSSCLQISYINNLAGRDYSLVLSSADCTFCPDMQLVVQLADSGQVGFPTVMFPNIA